MRWRGSAAIPARGCALVARKAFYTVVPAGPSYAVHSTRYVVASVAAYLLVLPAAIAGAWRWRDSPARARAPRPAVAHGRRDGRGGPGVLPAGAVPDSRDRPGADRDRRAAGRLSVKMNVLVVTPTYNERDNLPLLAAGVLKHRLPPARRGRRVAGRHRRDRRPARRRASRPRRGPAPHRRRAAWAARTWTACCTRSRKGAPISSARWTAISRTIPSTCPTGDAAAAAHDLVHRLALPERGVSVVNWPLSPDLPQRVRATATSASSPACRRATARAATAAGGARRSRSCRSPRWCPTAIRFSSRCCTRRKRRGFRIGEVPIIFVERRLGAVEALVNGADRIARSCRGARSSACRCRRPARRT